VTYTIAYARDEVVRYCGAWAKLADVDEAIAYALASLGLAPTDRTALVDADLAAVGASRWPQLRDVAAWQVYEAALNNCDAVSLKAIGIDTDVKSALSYLTMRVQRAFEAVTRQYNVGLGTISAGVLSYDFAAKGTDVDLGGGF
jgi:hypothetical protein